MFRFGTFQGLAQSIYWKIQKIPKKKTHTHTKNKKKKKNEKQTTKKKTKKKKEKKNIYMFVYIKLPIDPLPLPPWAADIKQSCSLSSLFTDVIKTVYAFAGPAQVLLSHCILG